jgi:two-component system OmpR family response regulator
MSAAHLLIIDDDAVLRDLLHYSLTRSGYQVKLASGGQEALVLLAEHQFDLVLLDIMMPGQDGYEICTILRADSSVPIIMLSSLDNPDAVVRGLVAGADDYITKPFQLREVEARIQALLRSPLTS